MWRLREERGPIALGLLFSAGERWVNFWGASGETADFLDHQRHLPKTSTTLYSKLGCLYQTIFPQPVKCHSNLHHLTFILITDNSQAAYKFFFCCTWGVRGNFTSLICLIIGCFYLQKRCFWKWETAWGNIEDRAPLLHWLVYFTCTFTSSYLCSVIDVLVFQTFFQRCVKSCLEVMYQAPCNNLTYSLFCITRCWLWHGYKEYSPMKNTVFITWYLRFSF